MNEKSDDFGKSEGTIPGNEFAAYDKMIRNCRGMICTHLKLDSAPCDDPYEFIMFNTLAECEITDAFSGLDEKLQVVFAEYNVPEYGKKKTDYFNTYIFGLMFLPKAYPPTFIIEETFREKLVDLFVKGDLDFEEQKLFSSNFHLVTQDKEKLSELWRLKNLDELAGFPEMEAEFKGNYCLFRASRKPVSQEETEKFIALAKTMKKLFG